MVSNGTCKSHYCKWTRIAVVWAITDLSLALNLYITNLPLENCKGATKTVIPFALFISIYESPNARR